MNPEELAKFQALFTMYKKPPPERQAPVTAREI